MVFCGITRAMVDESSWRTTLARQLERPLLGGLLIAGGYVALYMALQTKLWDGRFFLGWDAVRQAWADLVYGAHSFAAAELPLWNPLEKAGYSFIGDPEASPLYPLHWLLYLLVNLFGDGSWIVLARALLHYAVAGLGLHLYLRRYHRLHPAACWTGGLAYILSSRMAKAKDQAATPGGSARRDGARQGKAVSHRRATAARSGPGSTSARGPRSSQPARYHRAVSAPVATSIGPASDDSSTGAAGSSATIRSSVRCSHAVASRVSATAPSTDTATIRDRGQ